jgi:SMI1/KNR4 family protein SUKH-1
MTDSFGNKIKEKLQKLDAEFVSRAKSNRSYWVSEEYLQEFGHFQGCSQDEIEALKEYQKVDFIPKIYREFLEAIGHKSGRILFKGGDASYKALKSLKPGAIFIIEDCKDQHSLTLPPDAFVFAMFQSSDFFFFQTSEHLDDPPVYYYQECMQEFAQVADHLSLWFESRITEIEEGLKTAFK